MSEDRRGWIGGSDVSSIFGVNPWKTALELFEEKTAPEFIPPEVTPEREKLFNRGRKLEPLVLEMLQEEHGITPFKRNTRYSDYECPWMKAEVDFEVVDSEKMVTINGEVKTVSPFAASDWGTEQTDEIPLYYCLQVMHGLMVTGRTEAIVAALIGADDLRLYHVSFDEELAAEIRKRVVQFWTGHVIPRVPPPVQTVGDIHRSLYKYGGFSVEMDAELSVSLNGLRDVKKAEKELKEMKEKYEMEVKRSLLVKAEILGLTDAPKKFTILDETGKSTATLTYQHRGAYSVKETDYWVLRS